MTVGRRLQLDYWFIAGMACFLFLACPAFMVLAPWTSVVTVTEADEKYPGQVDPNWRAAALYHGRPHEWPLGTIADNPAGSAACTAALVLGVSGFVYCAYRSSRFQREKLRRGTGHGRG
jgi:hypothetical protein